MIKTKKALTAQTIILSVILIVSFVIILGFLINAFSTEDIDRQACHTSVVLRASASISGVGEVRDKIPLQCQTDNICMTSGFFSKGCEGLGKDYTKLRTGDKTSVLNEIADDIYSWHITLGEGKINPVPIKWGDETYCFIGSIISLDEKTKENIIKERGINYLDFYNTLREKPTSSGNSYLREIYGIGDLAEVTETYDKFNVNIHEQWNLDQDYMILTQFKQKGKLKSFVWSTDVGLATGIVSIVVLGALTGGVGAVAVIGTAAAGATAGGLTFYHISPRVEIPDYGPPIILPYNSEILNKLDCKFETLA